jgi:hypothetical protein
VAHAPDAFRVLSFFIIANPVLSLRSNTGLELANAFGVITQFQTEAYVESMAV